MNIITLISQGKPRESRIEENLITYYDIENLSRN